MEYWIISEEFCSTNGTALNPSSPFFIQMGWMVLLRCILIWDPIELADPWECSLELLGSGDHTWRAIALRDITLNTSDNVVGRNTILTMVILKGSRVVIGNEEGLELFDVMCIYYDYNKYKVNKKKRNKKKNLNLYQLNGYLKPLTSPCMFLYKMMRLRGIVKLFTYRS